ncbi:MAG: hypothetical protein QF464_17150, partial [Myxococcota bacterium]|nr:hypothetical protein [Myxococcota bacterium]
SFEAALASLVDAEDYFFSDGGERRYTWHSIVGFKYDEGDGLLGTGDPLVWTHKDASNVNCGGSPGTGYQAMSTLTGGLRHSLCAPDYSDLFEAIAGEVIEDSPFGCELTKPSDLEVTSLEEATITLVGDEPWVFGHVNDEAACGDAAAFFEVLVDGVPRIGLCPAACALVETAELPELTLDLCLDETQE